MRRLYLMITVLLFSLLILVGCGAKQNDFSNVFERPNELTYGYSPENPIAIRARTKSDWQGILQFLSRLRTKKGNELQVIEQRSVPNPNYKEPWINLINIYTDKPVFPGNGPELQLFYLKPKNEKDTIKIYINPFIRTDLNIPANLRLLAEE